MSAESVVILRVTYLQYTQLNFRIPVDSTANHITYCKLHQNGSVVTRTHDVSGWNLEMWVGNILDKIFSQD